MGLIKRFVSRLFVKPKRLSEQLELARYQVARGDIDNALELLQQIKDSGVVNCQACLLEAEIYCQKRNHEMKAVRLIEEYFLSHNAIV